MKYDFTSIMDRVGKDAIAVEALGQMKMAPKPPKDGFDIIPMRVADMNFPTVPTIPEAIIERAKHPAYGYFSPRKEYYNAIIQWQKKRNGVTDLTPKCIGYENGVLGGVSVSRPEGTYCSSSTVPSGVRSTERPSRMSRRLQGMSVLHVRMDVCSTAHATYVSTSHFRSPECRKRLTASTSTYSMRNEEPHMC